MLPNSIARTPRHFFALSALVAVALVLRLGFFLDDPNPYDSAGLAAAHGGIAHNIASHGHWFEANPRLQVDIDRLQDEQRQLVDLSEVEHALADARPRYTPVVLQPVGEGALLGAIWAVTGDQDYGYIQVLQILLDAGMVLLVYFIAMSLFARPRAALIAAGAYALFPPIADLAHIPHLDTWATTFTVSTVALLLKARDSGNRLPWLLLTGLVMGIGVYFRPGVLLLAPAIALALLPSDGWRRGLRLAGVPLVVAGLLMVPWTVRNFSEFDRFIPTRIGVGQNLWEGLGEVDNDVGAVLDDRVTGEQVHRVRPDLVYGTPEYDDYLRDRFVNAVKDHPGLYARVVGRRLVLSTVLMRSPSWVGTTESAGEYAQRTGKGRLSYPFAKPGDAIRLGVWNALEPLLFLLAMLTVALTARRLWHQHLVLAAVPLATLAPYLLLHFEPRYMLPATFVYMVWVGLGVDLLAESGRLKRPNGRRTTAPAYTARP